MRVLVTGGHGFLGRPTMIALQKAGHNVFVVSRKTVSGSSGYMADLLNQSDQKQLVKIAKADVLVHLAWQTNPGKFWTAPDNVDWAKASSRLIESFFEAGGKRAIVAGTCAEYDWSFAERPLAETSPCQPASLYGSCKLDLYRHCERLIARGASIAWGRLFFLFGPREHATRFAPAIIRPLLAGKTAKMSQGTQVRDFLHIDDAGRALAALVDSPSKGAVNIASGIGVSLAEFAKTAQLEIGRGKIDIGAIPIRTEDPPRLVADIRRLRKEVGFQPLFDWRAALRNCIGFWRMQDGRLGDDRS